MPTECTESVDWTSLMSTEVTLVKLKTLSPCFLRLGFRERVYHGFIMSVMLAPPLLIHKWFKILHYFLLQVELLSICLPFWLGFYLLVLMQILEYYFGKG